MKNPAVEKFEKLQVGQAKHPSFRPGDTIRVNYKIEEVGKGSAKEKKYRIQAFEGVCLRFRKGLLNASFTVRKIGANMIGIERIFPLYSPQIASIELISCGKVRRSRLYYLRERSGKSARIHERKRTTA